MECIGKFSGVGVRMHMQDYKSLSGAVVICTSQVNTHTHTDRQLMMGYIL